MRVTLFLFLLTGLLAFILWVATHGAFFAFGALILGLFIVITIGYQGAAILFFLGAREVKGTEEEQFYSAAIQEAYKLAVPQPRLYFYNGTLERAFVLQNRNEINLVLSKELIDICSGEELSAICFELLIQVKKNLASKRTKVMFLVGMYSWIGQGIGEILAKIFPVKELRQSINWLFYYFMSPWIHVFFKFTMGGKYFKKLEDSLQDYPLEKNLIMKVVSKLNRPGEIYSDSMRKLMEVSALSKSLQYRSIIALEFLPHEWDFLFKKEMSPRD
jgi:hypothetical protein